MNKNQQEVIEYLQEEVGVLKEHRVPSARVSNIGEFCDKVGCELSKRDP